MGERTQRTHPELWEACKLEAVEKLGKFSARAMQHAVALYKKRGGGYVGEKKPTALSRWQESQGDVTKGADLRQ